MSKGYIAFVLHAHLPFVRHPEYEYFLEENWLYEAISETYLPLLRVFRTLDEEQVPYKLTMSISPTLASMLSDELLQNRYLRHLKRLIQLAESECERTANDIHFSPVARMYRDLFTLNLKEFTEVYRKNILRGFKELSKKGRIELITSAATHSYLPLYEKYPEAIFAQLQTAVMTHARTFCEEPAGFWVPECAYSPGLEKHLKIFNFKYFFTAAHGVLFAEEKPKYGVYAPIYCPNGVAAFGRDLASSHAVWSSEEGYPGDFSYRDFYRDLGYDLPLDYIGPYIHENNIRINTGFKYYAITGKTDVKQPYNIEDAGKKAEEHADNFIYNRLKQVSKLAPLMDRPPLIVSPYDAELFGHWWFEGPLWFEYVLRKLNDVSGDLTMVTASEYLSLYPDNQKTLPCYSSWGNKGYSEVWLNASNDWIYRHTHKAIERMVELVHRFPDEKGLKKRALNQAAREVLLSQASDWPFIMKTGTTVPYAVKRVKEHVLNFTRIYEELCKNSINTEWLTSVEKRNNIFPDIDYNVFKSESGLVSQAFAGS
ncbi:MAG: DUF1957 domain-containing protein [Spirochaetales bacterium]|nr:MAG: DUF1957 domain-containing protein [Spirochaetales bacterium]